MDGTCPKKEVWLNIRDGKAYRYSQSLRRSHGRRKRRVQSQRNPALMTERITFTHATEYSEALAVIHETIGCTNVACKPVLTYKLSTAAKGVPQMSLGTEQDWQGCLEDVRQAEDAEKAVTVIPVMILVSDQYLSSLSAKRGKTEPVGKGRNKKAPMLDLDHAESGDDDFDDGLGTMDQEIKSMEQLDNQYGHCQACGPTKFCKITALRKNGVTLRTPPRDVAGQNLFGMFFKSVPGEVAPPASGPPMQSLFSGMMPPQMMGMGMGYLYMPWGQSDMPPMPPITPVAPTVVPHSQDPGASHASTSVLPAITPSSDPPERGLLNSGFESLWPVSCETWSSGEKSDKVTW
ncbi:hypothetical protein K438DRAFT_1766005 [Mycena galopus ATCC 62051]|nr:hypothetical protein K438DRAFT_1766005 [Mycena galopus ATCC 62051]